MKKCSKLESHQLQLQNKKPPPPSFKLLHLIMKTQIALTGIGLRFPFHVNTSDKLWDFLANLGDGIRQVPDSRWDLDKYYDPNPEAPGKMYVKNASFLHDDIFAFDPNFFGISPREASTMDPQQRLLLETTFEAFQDAGLPLSSIEHQKVGVYVGGFMMDNQFLRMSEMGLNHINTHTSVSGSLTLLSNRISHAFNLTGPSMSIDTACSSSLVAIHLACESLISGNSSLAIAGGVNVMLTPHASILMCKGKFLARDGRSKSFFDDADGYGRGEGAAMVVLKRLQDAERDGDHIYAVIEATAVNQDGHTKGISLPNQVSQINVIREALAKAAIDPADVDYVEAHGTGTKAGDPLELGALGTVYGKNRPYPLAVGSVKINLGHTEAAAGVIGLIKAALTLKNGRILPHMNLGQLNKNIPFEALNIEIPLEGAHWYRHIQPRVAAVNSFGYGGTNAHAILSRYTPTALENTVTEAGKITIQVSAKSRASLKRNVENLQAWISQHPEASLSALAHHLNHKRDRFGYLQLFRTDSLTDFASQLAQFSDEQISNPSPVQSEKLVWIFTGMGPQWWGMGHQLYRSEPVYRQKLDECDRMFRELSGFSMIEEMMKDEAHSQITRNYLAQSANFFVQVGLAALLMNWGLRPDVIIGHSVGEVAAAVVSGALDLWQGVRIINHRGCVLQHIAGEGTLLAASISRDAAQRLIHCHPGVEIAAINAPQSVTLVSTEKALTEVQQVLNSQNIFAKFVRVEVAYHSSQADKLKADFLKAFAFVQPQMPCIPLYSTVTGAKVTSPIQDADYWWRNVRNQVHFSAVIEKIADEGYCNFMEIGPHPVLGACVSEILEAKNLIGNTFHSLRRGIEEGEGLLRNLSRLMQAGVPVGLPSLQGAPKLELPLYGWDKAYHWEEDKDLQRLRKGENEKHPFLQEKLDAPYSVWKTSVNRPGLQFLHDHKVGSNIVFPGAGYLECTLAVANRNTPSYPLVVEKLSFDKPFTFSEQQFPKLYVKECRGRVEISSCLDGNSTPHMKGKVADNARFHQPIFDQKERFRHLRPVEFAYADLAEIGLNYGPAFQGIQELFLDGKEAFARLEINAQSPQERSFVLHPSLMDAAFQTLLVGAMQYFEKKAFLPVHIDSLRLYAPIGEAAFCYGRITSLEDPYLIADLVLLNEDMEVLAELKSLHCKKADISQGENPAHEWLYSYTWNEKYFAEESHLFFMPVVFYEEGLGENTVTPFQMLVDMRTEGGEDLYHDGLAASQRLLRLLQDPHVLVRSRRVMVVVHHALIDEAAYPVQVADPAQSPIVGMVRVAMTELPQVNFKLVDSDYSEASEALLSRLLHTQFDEEELILREGKLYVGSLERIPVNYSQREGHMLVKDSTQPKRLDILKPGKLETLVLRDYIAPVPKEDEVHIRVSHSSINFKDVMKAMGMLNEEALKDTFAGHEFGLEGTGVIEQAGASVAGLQPGDRVYFIAAGLKSHITVSEKVCVKIPEGLSLESMASIFVYITAWAGLVKMAHLKKGEKVLIHSGAGGVGLSACYIARMLGAEVHATAGTEEKRQFLRDLGIPYVYDSRSLNFADEVRANTGTGVDVVLNSLAGEPLRKSLELVKVMGRFVELGKLDITQNQTLDLAPFNRSIQFIALDLDKITPIDPFFMCEMVEALFGCFLSRELPMLPYQVLPVNKLEEAFRTLAKGSLIGKVVVDFNVEAIASVPELEKEWYFTENEVALITGGCSGYGLKSALYLAEWGLRQIALASRRGEVPAEERRVVEKLQSKGVNVIELCLDVSDLKSIEAVMEKLSRRGLKLAGVLHAATLLHDQVIDQVTPCDFVKGYAPKALGAWNLHVATKALELKFFACFSSIVSYTGNPGQLTYAAANAFLDGLMAYRQHLGLKGSSISWGAIGEVGILTRNIQADVHLKSAGVSPINPDKGLTLLKPVVLNAHPHVAIAKIDWNRWTTATPGAWKRLASLVLEQGKGKILPEAVSALLALKEEARMEAVITAVCGILTETTGAKAKSVTGDTKLVSFGMDSIMAVELTIEFQTVLGIELSVMEILGSGSVLQLAKNCLKKVSNLLACSDQVTMAEVKAEGIEVDLIESYLERICVSRPYFDLKEIFNMGEGLGALVEPVLEKGNIGMWTSESARHMAILGSCVAADANPENGRYCYPVKVAKVKAGQALSKETPERQYEIRAKLYSFDKRAAECVAETVLLNARGEVLVEMSVTYHVISMEGMYEMFKEHRNTCSDWQDKSFDPYKKVVVDELVYESDDLAVLPVLRAGNCIGHFDDLPAFPVSIMTRYSGQLLERRLGKGTREFVQGSCETWRFIFAGSRVALKLNFGGMEGGLEKWVCRIYANGEHSATLTYFLGLSLKGVASGS